MVTTKLLLDKRRIREDGTYPLIVRIRHNRQNTSISLETFIKEKDWNNTDKKVLKSCKNYDDIQRLNNTIAKDYARINDKLIELRDKKELDRLSLTELKKILTEKLGKNQFCSYALELADSLEKSGKYGNAGVYRQAAAFIKRNNKGFDLPFNQITYTFLKKMEVNFLSEDKSANGLSFYLRTIRAVYNKAIKEGLADIINYPFRNYEIKKDQTRKRAISREQIKKIEDFEVTEWTSKWHAKNYFLFSFYCRGMNFIDIAKLQLKNTTDNRIVYIRSKSRDKKLFSIEITEKIQKILDTYKEQIDVKNHDSFIFPVIKRKEPLLQRKDIELGRILYNKYLKIIGKECEITEPLTSYVARHTWASTAKKMGISTDIISEGMGHSDLKTTQIYLENFTDEVLDEANRRITE